MADGWIPGHAADWLSERYRTSRPVIDEAGAAVGRDPREIRTIFNFPGRISDHPLPATRDDDGAWIGGPADQWERSSRPYARRWRRRTTESGQFACSVGRIRTSLIAT